MNNLVVQLVVLAFLFGVVAGIWIGVVAGEMGPLV